MALRREGACRAGPPPLRYGATLSPYGWLAFFEVAESGACRAVAREARAGESGWQTVGFGPADLVEHRPFGEQEGHSVHAEKDEG